MSDIVFLKTLVVVAALTNTPATTALPVLANVLITLLLILITVDVFAQEIPTTCPPVPVEVKFVIVLEASVASVAVFTALPIFIAVILPCPDILLIVLLEILEIPFK